jgi:succinyl-CoA synthetase alpha subunit
MSILVNSDSRVCVQGITGREGMTRARLMTEYGTCVVAGVTPGKGGQEVLDVPVFDTMFEAMDTTKDQGGIDISVLFIPAPLVKSAAIEAIEAGVKFLVIVPDRVPIWDVMEIADAAKEYEATFLGPNTLGCLSVDQAVLGMMGGTARSAKDFFKPGKVGVSSRSGGITSSIAYYLSKAGIGLTTICHVGGDVIIGLPHSEVVKRFQEDPETEVIVMFGEIGTSQEERVADLMMKKEVTKPVVAYIGGKGAQEGTRFSHAGAIIEGGKGTREGKIQALKAAGAHIVEDFVDIPKVTQEVLNTLEKSE